MNNMKVVVLGCGFGGVEVASELRKRMIFDNRTQMNADNQDFKYKV